MPIDPKDFLAAGVATVDASKFQQHIHASVLSATTDAAVGITRIVNAGVSAASFLSPSAMGGINVSSAYQVSALSSIGALRESYDSLASLTVTAPYSGTLNTLATVGSIGSGINALYAAVRPSDAIVGLAGAVSHAAPFLGSTAIAVTSSNPLLASQVTAHSAYGSLLSRAVTVGVPESLLAVNSIASPYFASMSAVHSLEASVVRIGDTAFQSGLAYGGYGTGASAANLATLHTGVVELSGALRTTWDTLSAGAHTALLGQIGSAVLRSPAVELYTAVHAAASVSLETADRLEVDTEIEDILDEAVDVFESRLAALDQAFVTIYRGGVAALERGGSDWQRHCMVSFRELSTHVLHALAPDAKVLHSAAPADLHNDRPTRRARLNYVFGAAAGGAIASFYEADMKAALGLFDLLNDGTHRRESSVSKEQVHYLRGRLVGLVSSMLSAQGL